MIQSVCSACLWRSGDTQEGREAWQEENGGRKFGSNAPGGDARGTDPATCHRRHKQLEGGTQTTARRNCPLKREWPRRHFLVSWGRTGECRGVSWP